LPSKAKLESNKKVVAALADELKAAKAVVLVDYRGITVEQDTQMRAALRKAGVRYHIAKNSMLNFAVKDAGLESLAPHLVGPTALATSTVDEIAPAKVLTEYAKKVEPLTIKAGVVSGGVIDVAGVTALADMPPKESLVAQALGMLNSPMANLVYVLSANLSGRARALNAVAQQKAAQEGGGAAEATA